MRSTPNAIKYLNDKWGRPRHLITSCTYLRRELNWHCLTKIRIAARTGTVTQMDQGWKEQVLNYWMMKGSHNTIKRCPSNRQRLDGNTCSWERWRVDGDNVGRTKNTGAQASRMNSWNGAEHAGATEIVYCMENAKINTRLREYNWRLRCRFWWKHPAFRY